MDPPPPPPPQELLPGFADNNGYPAIRESPENEVNTTHTIREPFTDTSVTEHEGSDVQATPKPPTTPPPSELLSNNDHKSGFAVWRKLVAGTSSDTDAQVHPEKDEEKLSSICDVKESEGSQEPITSVMGMDSKGEKVVDDEDSASRKPAALEFPPFRSSTLAALTTYQPSEPLPQDDFIRPHLPPEEALSDMMMSFLDHSQKQSCSDSSTDFHSSSSNQAKSQTEVDQGQLANVTEEAEGNAKNDDPHYFDLHHDKELNSVLFSNSEKSKNLNLDKPIARADVDDRCLIDLEPVNTTAYENQHHNSDYILNYSPEVSDQEFNKGRDADNEEVALNEIVIEHQKPDFHRNADNPAASMTSHPLPGVERTAAVNEPESTLHYANLLEGALGSNGKTFAINRREVPVVYDEIATETEKTDGALATDANRMSISQAMLNVTEASRGRIDDEPYDSVMEQSELETGHELKMEAIVGATGTKRASLRHQSDSQDAVYEAVIESDEDETDRFGTSTVAVNPGIRSEFGKQIVDNPYDSVLEEPEEQTNSANLIIDTNPITADWLTELISQPPAETKPNFQPAQQAIPTKQMTSVNVQQQSKSTISPGIVNSDEHRGLEESVVKVARVGLQGNAPLFNEDSVKLSDRKAEAHDYINRQNFDNNQFAEAEKKPVSMKLEELNEADDTPPAVPPFSLDLPKQPILDYETKIYIQTMAREQRERCLLSIAETPGQIVRIEDTMSGKIIEVTPKDFVQVIKEHPIQDHEYDYLQGAASALDRYEIPSQRGSFSPSQTPQTPQLPPFYPHGFGPRHAYDDFDLRSKPQAAWDMAPSPAPRTRFSLAAPPTYNPQMNPSLAPPPSYLDQHQPYPGIEMTQQSAYPFNTNATPSPVGYSQHRMPLHPPPPLHQTSHQDPHAPPYPLYNVHPPGLVPQPQPSPQPVEEPQPPPAPARTTPITVNAAPEAAQRTTSHEDYRDEDERHRRRRRSTDEGSERDQKPRRYEKRAQRRRPSSNSVEGRNRHGEQQDCMKRHCCCWIVVISLMVLVIVLAAVGYFVWIHYWKKEPDDETIYSSTLSTTAPRNGSMRFI